MTVKQKESTSTLGPGCNLITIRLIFLITLQGDQEVLVINDDQGDNQLVVPPQMTITSSTDL